MTPDPWCTVNRHAEYADVRGNAAYVKGCRCTLGRTAAAAYNRRRAAKARAGVPLLVDITGTRRRIRALMAAGWPGTELAARLFTDRSLPNRWAHGVTRSVSPRNAARVAELYDEIGLQEGDFGRSSSLARGAGRRNGWPTPIEWGDNIDDPAAKPLNLDRKERSRQPIEDLRLLAEAGGTWRSMAARFGVKPESVITAVERTGDTALYELIARTSEHDNVKNRAA